MNHTASHSDMGPRDSLEDTAAAACFTAPGLAGEEVTILIACDGVGGNNYGEEASATALTRIMGCLVSYLARRVATDGAAPIPSDEVLSALTRALRSANQAILQRIAEDRRYTGMSTTAVVGLIFRGVLYLAWVGDSRCYCYRDGGIAQLTVDHSEVQSLVDAGRISPQEAKVHPLAHVINNYLGKPDFAPATRACPLAAGDIVLLCTDGLTDALSALDLGALLAAYRQGLVAFDDLPRRLAYAALRSGTQDNVTCVCCEFQSAAGLPQSTGKTLTEAYPAALAEACQNLLKESCHG